MINYIEKGAGLHTEITRAGYELEQLCEQNGQRRHIARRLTDGATGQAIDDAVQAIIDTYDYLAAEKKRKREELQAQWLVRLQARYPDIESRKEIRLFMDLWASARPAAVINARWQFVLDLETAFDNARATINGYTTVALVQAYNVVTMPAWPA